MAKISSASIRLVQKLNRKNKAGEYPIYIVVCFSGRVEKATGVSVLEKYWDSKREVIKKSCPNAPVLNKMLSDIKQRVVEKKNLFEVEGRRYTPQMLLENCKADLRAFPDDAFWALCERLITERRLKFGTIRSYDYTYKKLCEFLNRKDFIVDELTLGVVKDFAYWLERTCIKINTIKRVLACIAAAWNYAISRNIADASGYPFKEFKYTTKYKEVPRDYFLTETHIKRLKDYLLNRCVIIDGDSFKYREGMFERLHTRYTPEWGILWFLICYKLGGAAPVDIALLKTTNFQKEFVDGQDYWKVSFRRKKTDRSVTYMVKQDIFSIIAFDHFLGFAKEYVYPVINYHTGITDKEILSHSHHIAKKANVAVREAFRAINEEIVRDNLINNTNEPTVEVDRVTLYTARHSRASNYLYSPGATVSGLAQMMGRSANTIATYVHFLTSNKDIATFDDNCAI